MREQCDPQLLVYSIFVCFAKNSKIEKVMVEKTFEKTSIFNPENPVVPVKNRFLDIRQNIW